MPHACLRTYIKIAVTNSTVCEMLRELSRLSIKLHKQCFSTLPDNIRIDHTQEDGLIQLAGYVNIIVSMNGKMVS